MWVRRALTAGSAQKRAARHTRELGVTPRSPVAEPSPRPHGHGCSAKANPFLPQLPEPASTLPAPGPTGTPVLFSVSPPRAPLQVSPAQPTPSTGGRRRRTVDEDPDERRQRFLERNRAAASRCRQKRKLWVSSLEKKAEELTTQNIQLSVSM